MIQADLTVRIGNMDSDGIGVRIQSDQQQINGGTAAEAVFNGFTEIVKTTQSEDAARASSLPWAAQPWWVGSSELKWYVTTFR